MADRTHPFAAILLVGAVAPALAAATLEYQPIPGVTPAPITKGAGLKSAAELEAFLDGVMSQQLEPLHMAGATLAVVKDGKLFFAKGYGHVDAERQTPVDAARTLFRPGSVTKLFTATAVMQLVEQGKLDLDADVNRYLTQFQIPATFPQPITLRNLMTHSAGLDSVLIGTMWRRRAEDLGPLGDVLKRFMPARVNPPVTDFAAGRTASYSNWGVALEGLIVANVSGMEFDAYQEKYILGPLGMRDSTFREPLPPALTARMSPGFTWEGGKLVPHEFEFIHDIGPAGNLTSTATDMAKFMIAHLQLGRAGGARILREETARQMQGRVVATSPFAPGAGLHFYETIINGRRLIGHNGGTLYFNSDLYLLPEDNVGLFVSYNTAPTADAGGSTELIRAFMDRYYPARLPPLEPPADFAARAALFAGSYRSYRGSEVTVEKLLSLFGGQSFSASADGALVDNEGKRWLEVRDGVFRAEDSGATLQFAEDANGRMHVLPHAFVAAYKLRWFETSGFHYLVLGFGALAFVAAVASALRHWRSDRAGRPGARRARRLAGLLGGVQLAFLALLALSFAGSLSELIYGYPPTIHYALALPLVALPLTAGLLHFAVRAWREQYWTRYGRVQYTAIALASVAFLWSLNYWNLIGYKFA
jgi:CubicO group peptidase (beta-lactamase class C family)